MNGNLQNCELDNINLYPMKRTSWCLGALVASVTFFWVIGPYCNKQASPIIRRLRLLSKSFNFKEVLKEVISGWLACHSKSSMVVDLSNPSQERYVCPVKISSKLHKKNCAFRYITFVQGSIAEATFSIYHRHP